MGFFKKLFGSTPSPPVSPKVKEQYADVQISFVPSERLYKSTREKSEETVSENQQLWIDRYDKKVCPSCGSSLKEAPKQNRKCPECKDQILVRSHFQKKDKKVLLRLDEKEAFETEKKRYFDERWCIREIALIGVTEKKFMSTWKEVGPEFSSFDVMKVLVDRSAKDISTSSDTAAQKLYFERNRLFLYKDNFKRRGFTESAYNVLIHLIVRDFYLPFDKSDAYQIVPGLVSDLITFKEELQLTEHRILEDLREIEMKNYGYATERIDLVQAEKCISEILLKEKLDGQTKGTENVI